MIPYRTRKFLRSLFIGLAALVLAAAALLVCWMLWLGRYVVYTEDGVKLAGMLNAQQIEQAARSGDTEAIRALLSSVLQTQEGKRLAENVRKMMQD